ncbi:hypothetical protein BN1708_020133, partial [Verticillium longisporum]
MPPRPSSRRCLPAQAAARRHAAPRCALPAPAPPVPMTSARAAASLTRIEAPSAAF